MALRLEAVEYGGGGDNPAVVILHGLFGSARNWASIALRLATDLQEPRRVLALDLRNHGGSPWDEAMDYPAMAEDVRRSLDEHGIDRATVIGHSMGGKVAMALAIDHPDRVDRLVVVDVAPIRYPPGLRAYAEAMLAVDLSQISRRGEVDRALAPTIPEAPIRAFLLQNLVPDGAGFRWRLNLAVLAREIDTITGVPPLPSGVGYAGPSLFIRGSASNYVPDSAETLIARLFPAAALVTIDGAGHWLHAERPDEFLAAVSGFLAR